MGRRRALLFRKIVGAEGLTKSYNLRHYIVNRRLLRLGAALKIQRTYEKFRTKKWMHKTRDHHRAMAARQLQGRLRLWVNAIRKDNANRQINFAATQIQRYSSLCCASLNHSWIAHFEVIVVVKLTMSLILRTIAYLVP